MSVGKPESLDDTKQSPLQPEPRSVSSVSSGDEEGGEGGNWSSLTAELTGYSSSSSSTCSTSSVPSPEDDDCVIIKTVIHKQQNASKENISPAPHQAPLLVMPTKTIIRRPALRLKTLFLPAQETELNKSGTNGEMVNIQKRKLETGFQNSSPVNGSDDQQRRYSRRLRKLKKRKKPSNSGAMLEETSHRADGQAPARKKLRTAVSSPASRSGSSSSSGSQKEAASRRAGGAPQQQAQPTPPRAPRRVHTRATTRLILSEGAARRSPSPEWRLPRRTWPVEGMHERPVWPDPSYELPPSPSPEVTEVRRALHQSFHSALAFCVQIAGSHLNKPTAVLPECDSARCPIKRFLAGVEPEKLQENAAAVNLSDGINSNFLPTEEEKQDLQSRNDVVRDVPHRGRDSTHSGAAGDTICDGEPIVLVASQQNHTGGGGDNNTNNTASTNMSGGDTGEFSAQVATRLEMQRVSVGDVRESLSSKIEEGDAEAVRVSEKILALAPSLGLSGPSGPSEPPCCSGLSLHSLLELLYYTGLLYCTVCAVPPTALARYLDHSSVRGFLDFLHDVSPGKH